MISPRSITHLVHWIICFDKAIVQLVAQSHGVPVPQELFITAATSLDEGFPHLYPALIKPQCA